MNILDLLTLALFNAMKAVGSSKTKRYVVEPAVKDGTTKVGTTDVPTIVNSIVTTFLFILTKGAATTMLLVGNDTYSILDYQFPKTWWELVKGRKVFVSQKTKGKKAPYFKYDFTCAMTDVLPPETVNAFFSEFNANQNEGRKIEVSCVTAEVFDAIYTVTDFKGMVINATTLGEVNAAGTIDEQVAQVYGIKHYAKADQVAAYDAYEEKELQTWLMSLTW